MRAWGRVILAWSGVVVAAGTIMAPGPAEAGCRWFKTSHNGTDFFYSDGAAGTAEYKLNILIDQWKSTKGIKRAKVHRSKTTCGNWFIKYMLPHKNCVAKAKVCY